MSEHPEHLTPVQSGRGFAGLPALPGAYGGHVMIWESSAADDARLWLKVDVPVNANNPAGPTHSETIHLDVEVAWQLAEQLMTAVQNHYHGDSRPNGRVYDEVANPPEMVCNWKRPEHIRVETGAPAYQEITLICEHGHAEGYPTRRIDGPVVLDHRVIEFINAHKHDESGKD